jgi:RNA polymerase sigma-70 factor (ECF subfamily)
LSTEKSTYKEKSNRDLIADCLRERSVEAWQEFVQRFQPLLASATSQVARSWDEQAAEVVDDLVASVYLKLCADDCRLLKECRMDHDNSIFSYLKFMACTVAHDHFKKEHAKKRGEEYKFIPIEELPEPRPSRPSTKPSAQEQRIIIHDIEAALKEVTKGEHAARDQLVFWLHYRWGLTASSIAAIPRLGLSPKGVESLLARTVNSVKKELLRKKSMTKSAAAKVPSDHPLS